MPNIMQYNQFAVGGPAWFAVKCQPRKETLAEANLVRQGYTAYCPKILKTLKAGRSNRSALRPLFTGYLFVRLDLTRDFWRSVNGTFGVSKLVVFGERPAPVAKGFVERLQETVSPDGEVVFDAVLSEGEEVRVVGGAFDTLIGRVVDADDAERVTVLFELMNREIEVSVPRQRLFAS